MTSTVRAAIPRQTEAGDGRANPLKDPLIRNFPLTAGEKEDLLGAHFENLQHARRVNGLAFRRRARDVGTLVRVGVRRHQRRYEQQPGAKWPLQPLKSLEDDLTSRA